jgi:2-hydroxychromene-2-carboxylate isomerase
MTDPAPLLFYFDFASPYSYLASEQLDALAARFGRQVQWRPILLGGVFKALGAVSLIQQPGQAAYSLRDFARSARFYGLPFAMPTQFPVSTVAASRAYYWLHAQDCALARRFAHAVFRAYFAEGRDIADLATLQELLQKVMRSGIQEDGADETAIKGLEAGLSAPETKDRLRAETDGAVAAGVFGAPWIVVDGEPFWGADRLPQIERWLAEGRF